MIDMNLLMHHRQKWATALICLLSLSFQACGQKNTANRLGHCQDPAFDREVASWLSFDVPAVDVDSLKSLGDALILDAREPAEYQISHIEGARNCGYDHFDRKTVQDADRNKPVVVYCSIGYRSERIANRLKKMGFKKVYNLYGSIFEWGNRGYDLVDSNGSKTLKIHTFNQQWGKWVRNAELKKVH